MPSYKQICTLITKCISLGLLYLLTNFTSVFFKAVSFDWPDVLEPFKPEFVLYLN